MASSFVRSAFATFATLTLLALIVAAQSLVPDETLATEPIAYSGDIGEPVDADQFSVTVQKVRFAETVADKDGFGSSGPIEAHGVWLVATVRITSASAPLINVDAELVMDDGYVYSANGWLSNSLSGGLSTTLEAGIPVTGMLVFEVPEDRISAPVLQVNARESVDDRLSARADIDLGLSGAELDQRLSRPDERIDVPAPAKTS
ncbi:DUF4352 domain-containing protein [Streptomonospora wellingtoniae]|uniref:DUF4352 domain-containing protein n=1 Tax=Streptomonospora wellingtoniae TaxID=3075544 RepID=A0ABU2KXF2_9ACTN|nr:DUF4352 domain-containing protein [Streptomonospora sp. DSM 45055]MDT0303977.1 DUF4352 domain-containing protein [Streptomonospora sp. DSM 45055]